MGQNGQFIGLDGAHGHNLTMIFEHGPYDI